MRPNARITASLMAIVVGLACMDLVTPPAYGFALFYLVAVVGAAWWVGQRAAVLVAALSVLAWFAVNLLTSSTDAGALGWNTMTRAVIFLGTAYFVSRERARVENLRGENERIFRLAITDDITGLYNRHFMAEEGNRLVALAIRHRRPFAVVGVSIDPGHGDRDRVLRAAAALLQSRLNDGDYAIRLGDTRLAAILHEATLGEAETFADALRADAEAAFDLTAREARITLGAAAWRFGVTFEDVVDQALAALPAAAV